MSEYRVDEHRSVASHMDLSEDDRTYLEACIASAFGGGVTPEDARGHMAGDQVLIAKVLEGLEPLEIAGFASTNIITPSEKLQAEGLGNEPGAYFAGAAIARAHQGGGLYGLLNGRRIDFALEQGVDFIYTRTQNPRVQEGITGSINSFVERNKIRGFTVGRVITRGAYGKMLTAEKPVSRTLSYDDLDYENGDAALITWHLSR